MKMTETLLVEIFTEELPPKALKRLGEAFAERVMAELRGREFLTDTSGMQSYATPRRLAVQITDVLSKARDQTLERNLPPVDKSLDAEGNPTPALQKALSKFGLDFVTVQDLERRLDGKTERFFYRQLVPGPPLIGSLDAGLQGAVESLPIPKVMRYQAKDDEYVEFVRPAHGLVALHGSEVVHVSALGLQAGRVTHGHRFQGAKDISLTHADEYENKLRDQGGVIASFVKRRADIERQLKEKATVLGADLRLAERDALLDEVTALVEMPTIYVGEFDKDFLSVPQECLTLTMQQNQKYFPLFGREGKLLNKFLIVSNMRLDNPKNIVEGNQRVIRPRLADARFFFEQDRKVKLADRVPQLANIVYHNKLGSQLQRVERLQSLATQIARMLTGAGILADETQVSRAAYLSKADLLTNMVGEFPELQGVMGTYYARHDGEDDAVSGAIEGHYHPRFAGDALPGNIVGTCVALADRLDALVGIVGVGQAPTGDKDPFALRRAALGVVRLLVEKQLPLRIPRLLDATNRTFSKLITPSDAKVLDDFISERAISYFREKGFSAPEIAAVFGAEDGMYLVETPKRLAAVRAFASLPEAESLTAANKRVSNILKKADGAMTTNVNTSLFEESAETALHQSLSSVGSRAHAAFVAGDYVASLQALAALKQPIDAFFDKVMVNTDDPKLRSNRLGLLANLQATMNQVADISKLAA